MGLSRSKLSDDAHVQRVLGDASLVDSSSGSGWVEVTGRYSFTGAGELQFNWSHTELEFRVRNSKNVWIEMDGRRNFFAVHCRAEGKDLDVKVIKTGSGFRNVCVAQGLPCDGSQVIIRLVKRTEAAAQSWPSLLLGIESGVVTVRGVAVEKGGALVTRKDYIDDENTKEKKQVSSKTERQLEFIGDSDTAAFGVLSKASSLYNVFSLDAAKQDAESSWAAVVARKFGAKHHNISYSGIGAVFNAPIPFFTKRTMSQLYLDSVCGIPCECAPSAKFDAVVMYLGGNDWHTLRANDDKHQAFVDGYASFLRTIRELRQSTPIIVLRCDLTSATCVENESEQAKYSRDMEKLLVQACEAAGGEAEQIYLKMVDCKGAIRYTDKKDWGAMGHWSARSHVAWANGVVPIIEEILEWHSSTSSDVAHCS